LRSSFRTPFQSSADRWAHWLTLGLLMVLSYVVRMRCLAHKPFWFDECFSAEVARIDWHNFVHLLWWREANMSLYYVLLRMWMHFGQSEWFIRSLSVGIAVATLPAIYWLAGMLYDRRVALIASALFTFNAYSVRYSQEARSYALFLLLATVSSGFLVAFLKQGTSRNRFGYVLVSVLAVYAHFYALLLLAAQWLAVRGVKTDASSRSQLRRAWIVIGVAVLPLLIFVAKTGAGPIKWIPRPGLRELLEFYVLFAGGDRWPLAAVFAVACIAAVIPVGRNLLLRDQPCETWRCQFLLVWLLFPIVLTFVLSVVRPVFLGRYMIFCLPALLILVAAGLARLRRWWLIAPCLAGILLLSLQGVRFVYGHDFDNERDASGVATDFILDHTQAGDAVIFHIAETRVPYEFFRSIRAGENTASSAFTAQLGPEIIFPRHGEGLDYRDFTGKPTEDLVRAAAPGHRRVWVMLMNNGPAGNPDATTLMLTRALAEAFPGMERREFSRVEVRLYREE